MPMHRIIQPMPELTFYAACVGRSVPAVICQGPILGPQGAVSPVSFLIHKTYAIRINNHGWKRFSTLV